MRRSDRLFQVGTGERKLLTVAGGGGASCERCAPWSEESLPASVTVTRGVVVSALPAPLFLAADP